MKTIRNLLEAKGHETWFIAPDASAYQALQHLADKDVGALLVLKDGQVVGIISERDCVRKIDLEGSSSRDVPVSRIMSTHVMFISPERSVEEAMALMTDKHVRHLPVMENERLVGVISIGDVVKEVIAEREFEIKQLERYIRGDL